MPTAGKVYDALVVGLGAMGSSTLYHLARQGTSVMGLESQRHLGHSFGSSGGHSRITRLCYHEGPEYVPLLKRSFELFLALEASLPRGDRLLHRTGMLDVGLTVPKAQIAAKLHGLEHTLMTGSEVSARYPGYQVPADWPALYQPLAGILLPEKCIQAHCNQAMAPGTRNCTIKCGPDAQVVGWRPTGTQEGVEVRVASGEDIRAQQLVVTAGSWAPQLLPELKELCTPVRQAVGWFGIAEGARRSFSLENFPCFIVSRGNDSWYGFPEHGDLPGFKIGKYQHSGEKVHPDSMNRSMTAADEEALRTAIRQFFPAANGPLLNYSTCLFTNTPDGHFIIDRHPCHPQVLIVSACSGHGFKMSSGIGKHAADMVLAAASTSSSSSPTDASATQERDNELALHRINRRREGHADFLKRALQAARMRWAA